MYNLMDVQVLVWSYSPLCMQRPEVKLSHLHARSYSLRQGLSLIHRVAMDLSFLCLWHMLVLQPKASMHISLWEGWGFEPGLLCFHRWHPYPLRHLFMFLLKELLGQMVICGKSHLKTLVRNKNNKNILFQN